MSYFRIQKIRSGVWRVLNDGYTVVHDSRGVVLHYHHEKLRQIWYRSHLMHVGYANFLELPVPSRYEILRRVCEQTLRQAWHGTTWRQRIGPLTVALPGLIAREIGRYTGLREAKAPPRLAGRKI
jgi:hypothetical protein